MRKIVLVMVVLAGVSAVCLSTRAGLVCNEVGTSVSDGRTSDTFYAVDVKCLTPNIQEALYNAYPNCLVKEAYKSDSNLVIKYKFILTTQEGKEARLFMNEKGEVITRP